MSLIVQKFGGTSVGSTERIKNVAKRVARWKAQGHQIVVVPSAMSGETNRLIALAKEISPIPDARELDVVASTGEQVTIGLLSMALMELGVIGRQADEAGKLKLHASLVALFLVVAHVAMIFGMVNPSLMMG